MTMELDKRFSHTVQGRGIGLVEMMIVVVVLGVIAAVAAPSFTDMLNRRRVQAVATTISTDLAYLRSQQMLTTNEVDIYVNPNPTSSSPAMSCYRIVVIATDACNECWTDDACASTQLKTTRIPLTDQVTFSPGGTWSTRAGQRIRGFKYDTLRLQPSPADYHVDVCGRSSSNPRAVLRVEFNAAGRTSICSPNGSMSGYGPCNSTLTAAPLLCN